MNNSTKMLRALVCLGLIAPVAGCGLLLHPERQGQRGGRLDVGIVALDGIGLLLFLIPGLIAFAIDFTQGTIYLPGGALGSLNRDDLRLVRFDPRHANAATIEEIVWKETGQRITLHQDGMQVSRLQSLEEMRQLFAKMPLNGKAVRVASTTP